jgi:aminopeptidase N
MRVQLVAAGLTALTLLPACGRQAQTEPGAQKANAVVPALRTFDLAAQPDRFSYSNPDEIAVRHVTLDLKADFETRTLSGTATLEVERRRPDADALILDANDLSILSVEARIGGAWAPASYILGADDPVLGSPMQIALPPDASAVRIAYRTDPGAEGLQWLTPAQTAGKRQPFMYSQNQAIHARSMAPLQDTPAVRMTYEARIEAPAPLTVVMGAIKRDADGSGAQRFEMPQPIPSYLIAIAIGDLAFKAIDEQSGVWAEPELLDAAAAEFSETPEMIRANTTLYGPYLWDRYDMLVLPPSFPFGGMENPRLTFLTPTVIAGDKSLTNVIAHELAHSWSGNLVTNSNWRDAWLNEGVTSYVENRVVEVVYGPGRAAMERALDLETLRRTVAEAKRPELTQLKMPADILDPDEAFSQVSYLKGAFFLNFLERRFGRAAFDAFLKDYFARRAFSAVTTEDFLEDVNAILRGADPNAVTDAEIDEWVYRPGVPATIETPQAPEFEAVDAAMKKWLAGAITASALPSNAWTTQEWLRFINGLPRNVSSERLAELDGAFRLSEAANAEIAAAWFLKTIPAGYDSARAPLETFLKRVGRGKFIYRLYDTLKANDQIDFARAVYADARPGYHPIAQKRIDEILKAP